LDVALVERHRVYYKGEGDGKSEPWWVLWIRVCPWLILTPKVLQLCTNHLVLVLCRSVWVVEVCQFVLVPSWNSNTPLYLSKMLLVRECALTPYSSAVFCLGLTFEPFKELKARQLGFSLSNCVDS
jgi:hypothetical protein